MSQPDLFLSQRRPASMRPFRPMLAVDVDKCRELRYPCYGSPKYDGIRCVTLGDIPAPPQYLSIACTRSLKRIPNDYIFDILSRFPAGLDGEIVTYTNGQMDRFNEVQHKVMSQFSGEPDFKFHIFDHFITPDLPWIDRWNGMASLLSKIPSTLERFATLAPQVVLCNEKDLMRYREFFISGGYEGMITRDPNRPYKYGRSTPNEQTLVKHKDFITDEAVVIGVRPLMRNKNPGAINELGYQERTTHQANMVADSTRLGALIVRHKKFGEFAIGSGFTDDQRQNMMFAEGTLKGRIVTFKYQPHGMKDAPRIPIFVGFRDTRDL